MQILLLAQLVAMNSHRGQLDALPSVEMSPNCCCRSVADLRQQPLKIQHDGAAQRELR
ncbi:hypothetical protein [Chromatium okenii]|nr:hypothetical protein [Chromatium okenii]